MPITSSAAVKGFGFTTPLPVWSDSTLTTPTYNVAYSDGVLATTADGSSITYTLVSGSLPSGFSLNSSTGAVTGTYTTPVNATQYSYSFAIRATNASGFINQSFNWTISIPFTTSGGTSWDSPGAGYTGRFFTSSGTFTVNTGNKSLEVLIVGAGGGGGGGVFSSGTYYIEQFGFFQFRAAGAGGAGGGAGGTTTATRPVTTGNYSISVGAAGAGGSGYNAGPGTGYGYQGSNGGFSQASLGGVTIGIGGGQGGYGGYADAFNLYAVGQAGGISGDSRSGGSGSGTSNTGAGGGGGGYTTNGGNASGNTPGSGGNSRTWNTVTVGGGGSGASSGSNGTTSANRGGGGGGGNGGGAANGLTATAGVVYIRWLT